MDQLVAGYRNFRTAVWPRERERFRRLAEGQRPQTLVVACSDSRVDPQMVFGAAPGELFVVRNVGALVPPYRPDGEAHGTSAALEFGVRVLAVASIVVLGHALCGGVAALREGAPAACGDFLDAWTALAAPALGRTPANLDAAALQEALELEVVRLSLEHLTTFPWIAEAVDDGRLSLHGTRFDIRTGTLWRLSPAGRFVEVEPG